MSAPVLQLLCWAAELSDQEGFSNTAASFSREGENLAQLLTACDELGSWMSAALEDDGCDEFKKAANEFLASLDRVIRGAA